MADEFTIDLSKLELLERYFNSYQRGAREASALYLTAIADQAREEIIHILHSNTTVRNPKFVANSIRVWKATRRPIAMQFSKVYSVAFPRSTGFLELETGGRIQNQRFMKRIPTMAARMKKPIRKMITHARLRQGTSIPKSSEFNGRFKDKKHQTTAFLHSRQNSKAAFIIDESPDFVPGLYKYVGKRLVLLQAFKPLSGGVKKVGWMSRAVRHVVKSDTSKLYQRAVKSSSLGRLTIR